MAITYDDIVLQAVQDDERGTWVRPACRVCGEPLLPTANGEVFAALSLNDLIALAEDHRVAEDGVDHDEGGATDGTGRAARTLRGLAAQTKQGEG